MPRDPSTIELLFDGDEVATNTAKKLCQDFKLTELEACNLILATRCALHTENQDLFDAVVKALEKRKKNA